MPLPEVSRKTQEAGGRTFVFPPCWSLLPHPLLPNSGFLSLTVAQTVPHSQSLGTIWGKGIGGCHLWLDWAAEQSILSGSQALGEIPKYWSFEPGIKTSCFNSTHDEVFLSSYLKHVGKNTSKCAGQSSFLPQFQPHQDPCTAPACPAPDSWISLILMVFIEHWIGKKSNINIPINPSFWHYRLNRSCDKVGGSGRWIKPALPRESTQWLCKVWRPRPKQSLT